MRLYEEFIRAKKAHERYEEFIRVKKAHEGSRGLRRL